jgi:hypothetical protein
MLMLCDAMIAHDHRPSWVRGARSRHAHLRIFPKKRKRPDAEGRHRQAPLAGHRTIDPPPIVQPTIRRKRRLQRSGVYDQRSTNAAHFGT